MKRAATRKSGHPLESGAAPSRFTVASATAKDITLSQKAYLQLRNDILDGAFEAGKPLRLEALKARYNVSFSPLREALNRLQSERLVEASASGGFRLAELSVPHMWDAIETRILIEGEALSRAIARGGDDWEASMIGSFHALSRCVDRFNSADRRRGKAEQDELEGRHHDFHSSLIVACGSNWLIDFSNQLYEQTERYRRPVLNATPRDWFVRRDITGEHEAIMKAVLKRNPKLAILLLSEHYRKTGQMIERRLRQAA